MKKIADTLKNNPIFTGLDEILIDRIAGRCRVVEFTA